jgi:hypothetical protein
MGVVGRLDQYASMLATEFDDYSMSENLMTSSQLAATTILNDGGAVTLSTDTTVLSPYGLFEGVLKCVHTTSTGGYFRRGQLMSLTAGVTYTFSVFFKNGTVSNPYGQGFPEPGPSLLATTGVGGGTGPLFENIGKTLDTNIPLGNGWYRQFLTFTPAYTQVYQVDFNQSVNQSPIGTYYLYGFQLEVGSTATDYTPTTTTAINRVLASTTNTNITGLGTYYSSGFYENVGVATFLPANISAPYDPVYDDFGGTFFGAGQGRYKRQNTDKSVIVYNEIDEVTDFRDIVRIGLVLDLDAAQPLSYKGTGTTWTDLSGNGNNGTLVNMDSANFNSANGGSLTFDGTNEYITLPTNLLIHETGNPFTFSIWFKTSSTGIILGQQNNPTPNAASGYVPAIYVGTDGLLYTSCFWGGSTGNQSVSSSSVNNSSWNNITVTFAANSQISYLNGVSYATLSKTQTNYSSTYYYFLGSGQGAAWFNFGGSPYYNGSIATTSYYNRALTATEITQNYNALKHRFGL